jgi:hypothetical protein
MKSIAALLLIGAISIEDIAGISNLRHHKSEYEYAQLNNMCGAEADP